MWRTPYGRNGEGYCIVTPLTAFEQGGLQHDIEHGGEVVKVTEREFGAAGFLPPTLYAVSYDEGSVKDTLRKLKSGLKKIKKKKEHLTAAPYDRAPLCCLIASHILYLYKNNDYESEREARMIGDFDISFNGLKLDSREKPSRIYVESDNFLLREGSIVIGPTVPKQTVAELDLKYRLKRHGLADGFRGKATRHGQPDRTAR